jgi:hypothetical protein
MIGIGGDAGTIKGAQKTRTSDGVLASCSDASLAFLNGANAATVALIHGRYEPAKSDTAIAQTVNKGLSVAETVALYQPKNTAEKDAAFDRMMQAVNTGRGMNEIKEAA